MLPRAGSCGGLIKETEKQGAASMRNVRERVQLERQHGALRAMRRSTAPNGATAGARAQIRGAGAGRGAWRVGAPTVAAAGSRDGPWRNG